MRFNKKVKYRSVNYMCVIDDGFRIMIIKKPKRRYRTIIREFYRMECKRGVWKELKAYPEKTKEKPNKP